MGRNQVAGPEKSVREADPRSERSYMALIGAMERLARAVPLNELTITRIVKEAEVTRPTFYQHFTGIHDLARTAALADLDRAIPEAPAAPPPTPCALRDDVAARVLPALRHLEAHRDFYLNVLQNGGSVELFSGIIRLVTHKMLPDAFRAAGGDDTGATEDLMSVVAAGIMWMVVEWLRNPDAPGGAEALAARIGRTMGLMLAEATGDA